MDFTKLALTIGSKLCRNAIWADDRCTWMAPCDSYLNAVQVQREYRPLDYDVYAGCSGTGAFLSSLYKVSNDNVFKIHAEGALKNNIALLKKSKSAPQGFFNGTSGVAAMLIKSGSELNNEEFIENGIGILKTLVIPDSNLLTDIISGAAGIILGLVYLKSEYNIKVNEEYLAGLGDFLLGTAKKENNGTSWKTSEKQKYNLTGLAHGTAGIAIALLKLYELYGENRFLQGALDAIAYENSLYAHQLQNWPDLRNVSDEDFHSRKFKYSNAWCHGAPGIGLSRLYFYRVLGSQFLLDDIKAAVATTIAGLNSLPNYSICHGIAGNLDFLMEANKIINDPAIDEIVRNACEHLNAEYLKYYLPITSGLNDNAEIPGLMLGLAGTGYFLLRCADLENVQSILLLA